MKHFVLAIAGLGVLGALYFRLVAQDEKAKSVWDGVYTEQQATRGLARYNEHCLDCHGTDLEGDDENPPLRGPRFFANWEGQKLGSLYDRILRGMPLNSEVGTLGSAVSADLLAYILSINRFPPGSVELPHAVERLNQIQFDVKKPASKR
jgi:mono/diheme cytochrome c family protein